MIKSRTIAQHKGKQSSVFSPRQRAAKSSAVLQPAEKQSLPIIVGYHRVSRHLIQLQPRSSAAQPPTSDEALPLLYEPTLFWQVLNKITVVSLLGLILALAIASGKYLFRVPIPPLPSSFFRRHRRFYTSRRVRTWPRLNFSMPNYRKRLVVARRAHSDRRNIGAIWNRQIAMRLGSVAMVGFLILIPLRFARALGDAEQTRSAVLVEARDGWEAFRIGSNALLAGQYAAATSQFQLASERFSEAREVIEQTPSVLRYFGAFLPNGRGDLSSATHALGAGQAFAEAATVIAAQLQQPVRSGPVQTELLDHLWRIAPALQAKLATANQNLAHVDARFVPDEYQDEFETVRDLVAALARTAGQGADLQTVLTDMLGYNEPRRYLVMFHNNRELRASGGFIGSYALIDVHRGEVTRLDVPAGGTYDRQGSLLARVAAPAPLQLVNPRWEWQDSNWWIDWPTSAEKIMWFYGHSGGSTVDGVVAVNSAFLERLLALTGPIALPDNNLQLTEATVIDAIQEDIASRRNTAAPKQLISQLAPALLQRLELASREQSLALLTLLERSWREKDLMFYQRDQGLQERIANIGWSGSLPRPEPNVDYLALVRTNIAGGKSDGVVSDAVSHNVQEFGDGRRVAAVTITRRHTGRPREGLSGVRNVDYLRVYVPLGSQLLYADGFTPPAASLFQSAVPDLVTDDDLNRVQQNVRINSDFGVTSYDELGYTVFAHWVMVDPGQEVVVRLRYQLPSQTADQAAGWPSWAEAFRFSKATHIYKLVLIKQPGAIPLEFNHSFETPMSATIIDSTKLCQPRPNGWSWQERPTTDTSLVVAYQTQ